tara:strand:+ start:927 stop:1118 length:192 start_codon:yes stop_codon:yes gene_type:complete
MLKILNLLIVALTLFLPTYAFSRCAVCYTNGMSGASIAVIVIVFSAIFLFIANKLLHKYLLKD